MTEHSNQLDAAERIRRLQERRAASGRAPRTNRVADAAPASAQQPADPPAVRARTSRQRRSHPAAATRWLLGGLSVASFFGIAGTVAAANVHSLAASSPATVTSSAPVSATSKTHGAAVASAQAATAAHTTTHGS